MLRALHAAGPPGLTLTELVRSTEVARATVENALAGLVELHLAAEAEPDEDAPRQVGRPAKRYRFHAAAGRVLGLDVGVHKVLAVVADLSGTVLGVRRTAVSPELPPERRLAAARALGRRALRGTGEGPVRAVGVGTTGIVTADHTVAVSSRLPGWAGTDLAADFREGFGAPVVAGNDSKLAALGERWRGSARTMRDVVYVHVGRRISTGIVLGGTVLHGTHGAAGEIGELPGSDWHRAHERLLARWGTPEALFAAVRERDRSAARALDSFIADLVQGIAPVVLTVDPEAVVIGGGLSRAGDVLLDPLRARLSEVTLFPVAVVGSELGDEAVAHGALRLALDTVEAQLFGMGD
ncbi:ROK family protein [Streptomyces endophyticus]|uniref:ROK family protein n=1 Tax=Streptomyces endophyticus TaxID=714166 RepID=A0ABU6F654_9ACTN|nr:ROK family protein [Streptomyces endophyticus]MEB8339503.1 ROK family protein [Streptomyces endophyticus]